MAKVISHENPDERDALPRDAAWRDTRRPITGVARLAQRMRLLLNDDGQTALGCTVCDASEAGFRVALTRGQAVPEALAVDDEIVLEHSDKSRLAVRVRWVRAPEIGLEVLGALRQRRR
jgi:hypothetical protein